MGLRDLIFENKGEDKKPKKKKEKEEAMSFPTDTGSTFETKPNIDVFSSPSDTAIPVHTPSNLSCEPHIDTVMSLYEQGFDSLNKDGYDFYEYYKAILGAGADNPEVYKMALNMAKAMDPNVSKQSLIKQSEYYLKEITNVYKNYEEKGKAKKKSIETQKQSEESSLNVELNSIQSEIQKLQQQENSVKVQIGMIDNKYATQLHEISCKLEANDTAKREIFESINKVKQGINTNL